MLLDLKLTEIIGILGFILALITFILTRFEKRKKLRLHLKFEYLVNIDRNAGEGEKKNDEIELITVEVINDSSRIITIDIDSLEIRCNNVRIKNFIELVGKDKYRNPLSPGEKHQFGVFVEEITEEAEIPDRHHGIYPISAKICDLTGKTYRTRGKYVLLLEVDDIVFGKRAKLFLNDRLV